MSDIAVVGLDCRFPKADDPAALWTLLLHGADGIDEIPAERWNAAELHDDGAVNHRAGGLISDADAFDNDFFGIAPREAMAMDPQHACSCRRRGARWKTRPSTRAGRPVPPREYSSA